MKKTIILILLLLISYSGFSQNCNCSSNLNWLKETFEKNDAGFQYIIDQKGENAYAIHNEIIFEKAKSIIDLKNCHELLQKWTEFFRKGHLDVILIAGYKNSGTKLYGTYKINLNKFEKYLENSLDKKGFEGIWVSSPYKIGIVKDDKNKNRDYVGFIMSSENPNWKENEIKLEIIKNDKNGFDMNYYMGDHSVQNLKNIKIEGNKYLVADYIHLEKIKPKTEIDNSEKELYYKSIYTSKPFLKKINNNTILLRIPSFNYGNKKEIDALLTKNDSLIKDNENLIIDLRNNGGGADASYSGIINYIYSNPYRVVGLERLSTQLNNNAIIEYSNRSDLSENEKEWAKQLIEKLNAHIGEFVISGNKVSINKRDTVFLYPKKIGIIINENCGSTTEQFLLAAKQSKKVKLFGKTTTGALDISNLNSVKSPCKEFELWYGTSKSFRIPEMTIDDKGIQPDYYFDKSIKLYEWIDRTVEILNYK